MRLSTRIGAGFLALVALMIAVGGYQLYVIAGLRHEHHELARSGLEGGKLALQLRRDLLTLRELTEKLRILVDPEYADELARRRSGAEDRLEQLAALPLSAPELAAVDSLATRWQAYAQRAPRAEGRVLEWGSGRSLDPELAALDELLATTQRLTDLSDQAVVERLEASAAQADRARRLALVAALVGLFAAVGTSLLVVRSIARALGRLERGAEALRGGDLSYRVPTEGPDEFAALATDFNAMAGRLEEVEQLKRDFVSMVSHELKAPLASIQETLSLVLDRSLGPLNDEQEKILRLNRGSAERLSEMIRSLLDLACLEAGAMEFDMRRHDMVEIARSVLLQVTPSMARRKLRLRTEFPPERVEVWGDAELLRQVLINLMSNAMKFTPEGGEVTLSVEHWPRVADLPRSLARRAWQGEEILSDPPTLVRVSDSGPGVPDTHKELVFERFHRVDSERQGRQGTGLGLPIARGIVAGHGGRLWVEDRPGGGASFVIMLGGEPPPPSEMSSADARPNPEEVAHEASSPD